MPAGDRLHDTAQRSANDPLVIDSQLKELARGWAKALARFVGEDHVMTGAEALAWASRDALDDYRAFGRPPQPAPVLAVVQPGTAQEVAAVLAWASREGVPVVPRGGGTGVMGAAIPVKPAVALDMSRLDDVQVHREDMRIEAGAGATLARVAKAAEAEGLLFAHDPWSLSMATVGGAISTNGMGYLFGPYGKMGDQVLGLEVALADGTVIRTRPTLSGGPGPMLHKLFVGAEGIFGVITRAWLRAWPLPEARRFGSFRFDTFAAGFHAVTALLRLGIVPTVMDMSDTAPVPGDPEWTADGSEEAVRESTELHLAFFGTWETVDAAWSRAERELLARGGQPLGSGPALTYWDERYWVADEYERHVQRPRDWRLRPSRFRAFEYINVELPLSQVLPYREACLEHLRQYPELRAGETGLWGRPEIFSIVIHDVSGDERGAAAMRAASDHLVQLAQDFGGTMEAIHGPGAKLEPFLRREWGQAYDVIRAIKAALDPSGVLHAGRWQ
ncbi:MAG: FAD-binding oxidoreductase [Bacillota bacterium]|nr:FAD-binding oxidoreductase [Bacillota bacterium]